MVNHLKSKQYYIDLYDRQTVEICRRSEKPLDGDSKIPKNKNVSKKQMDAVKKYATDLYIHVQAGERYLNKEKTIREWMESDQRKDQLYESAQPPEDIRCLTCRNRVKVTFKQLWSDQGKEDRVLFMFDCPNKCLPRRAFFSDGEEWRVKPNLCFKCDTALNQTESDDGTKLVTTHTCPKCGHIETSEYVWTHKEEEEIDENFGKDRDRFCLTDEEGSRYQEEKWNFERLGKFAEEWKKKDEERADKLKQNPKGFHLEGVEYTCAICGDHTPEGDNWYDEYGIKCLVCQKAIDNKEIPASLAKDKDSWYTKYDFEHYFNVKGQTLRKWVKDGILKSRNVSKYGEGIHVQMFLLKDNKDFLPPKKMLESRSVKERKDGKDWYTSHPWYHFVDPIKHLKGYKIMDYMRVVPADEMAEREAKRNS